jgi:hypothetical protein
MSAQREFLIKFVSGTIFGVLWPERMARDRRRRQSLKGVATTALTHALVPYCVARAMLDPEEARRRADSLGAS